MSFDVNVGRTRPMINPAAKMANNGGSNGNTGFMGRQGKKKQSNSIFDGAENYNITNPFRCDEFVSEENYLREMKEIENSWTEKIAQFVKKSFNQTEQKSNNPFASYC